MNNPGGFRGFRGGGGPPDDPDDGPYDDRESEDSANFPSNDDWPPYGVYYRAKPPHPKLKLQHATLSSTSWMA